MSRKSLTTEQIMTILTETPGRIAALTADLAPAQLRARPAADEWSANEVLAHLRSCADVWGDCIATIIAEDKPTIQAVNPRTWIKKTDYREQEFVSSLQAFTAQRRNLLVLLEGLPPESWSRSATVTGAGKPLVRTVLSYAQRMALHERPHVKQIAHIADTMRG